MSFTYPQTPDATRIIEDRRRTRRTIILIVIILIVILIVAIILYIIIAARNNAATTTTTTSGTTTITTCTNSSQCPSTSPICNTTTGLCVECTAASPGVCSGGKPVCRDSTQSCVQCNISSDCPQCGFCSNNLCYIVGVPTITSCTYNDGNDTVDVSWIAVPGAASYNIQISNPTGGAMFTEGVTSYTVTGFTGTSAQVPDQLDSNGIHYNEDWCNAQDLGASIQSVTACGVSNFSPVTLISNPTDFNNCD
jgi:hypothetical protein